MGDLFPLSEPDRADVAFPLARGVSLVDDRRVVSGIVSVIPNGLWWKDAPPGYGPHRRSTTASSAGALGIPIACIGKHIRA